jgi:hypothetical protein
MRRTRLSSGFIGRGLIITLAAALAGVIAVSLVFLVGVRPAAAAPSSLELPFSSGQTWVICQGYNNSQISHFGKQVHALDLSIDRKSALPTSTKRACVGNANASTGKTVFAPSKGTIARTTHSSAYPSAQNDLACIKFDPSPGSALVGHIRPSTMPKVGTSVNAGQPIGAGQSNGPSVLSSGLTGDTRISTSRYIAVMTAAALQSPSPMRTRHGFCARRTFLRIKVPFLSTMEDI